MARKCVYPLSFLYIVEDTTASTDDFEVIVVSDETEDNSMEVEQENQGLRAAHMCGVSLAAG